MRRHTTAYVIAIVLLALLGALGVAVVTGGVAAGAIAPAICFAALGFFAQALGHSVGKKAQGNISFIPYLALSLLTPTVSAVLTIAIAVAVVEASARREALKGLFNVAQYTLAAALAVLSFRVTGGVGFLGRAELFTHLTAQPITVFLPSAVLVLVFLLANNSAVSGAIAISEGRSFWEIWRATALRAAKYDVLSLPFVLMFVAAYSIGGAVGAIVLAAPMLAVRQLYKTNSQLQRTNQDLLQLMVAAIEARDPYTSGHSRRVSQYARTIAESVGLSRRETDRIATAALLHDVGKIYEIFAPILQKPGKLTPEERAIMETHPLKSADLVAMVSHLADLVEPVLRHHEHWDGSGYPGGLRGEEIPLASRVIMLADTIDAMTTDRPYRKALGEAEVRRELMRFRGLQFDPDLCDRLVASPRFVELFTEVVPSRVLSTDLPLLKRWRESRASA